VSEFNPKHRIVGAIVLVAAGVIFLPMLVETHRSADNAGGTVVEIPQQDKKIFVSKITPVTGESDGQNAAAKDKTPVREPATGKSTPQPEPKPKQPAVASKTPAVAKAASEKSANTENGWAVRIGTFAQRENAKRIVGVLKKKGFKPRTEDIETAGNKATRVWLGPYGEKVEAQAVRKRILEQTGQEGLIVSYP